MTLSGKSRTVVLTGVLALGVAVALPLLPAFGEGGARRDVVRHSAESNAATMDTLYQVEFEATQAGNELRADDRATRETRHPIARKSREGWQGPCGRHHRRCSLRGLRS